MKVIKQEKKKEEEPRIN